MSYTWGRVNGDPVKPQLLGGRVWGFFSRSLGNPEAGSGAIAKHRKYKAVFPSLTFIAYPQVMVPPFSQQTRVPEVDVHPSDIYCIATGHVSPVLPIGEIPRAGRPPIRQQCIL